MNARHHHYLSQCYLRGFSSGNGKKSKLTVFDFQNKKIFETTSRNVGGLRDFNRIDIEGIDPNLIENSLSAFESLAATALKKVSEGEPFDGENREVILNLIALLSVRSPERREHIRRFHSQVAEHVMDLTLATEERWRSQIKQMKAKGIEVNEDVSYEDLKKFMAGKNYKLELAREYHIHLELEMMNTVTPFLLNRRWTVVRANDLSGPFVTSDNPVVLMWKNPENIPPFYRQSPGFGMMSTQVFFPISSRVGIIGEFEGETADIQSNENLVANLNSIFLNKFFKQVYAPKTNFKYIDPDGSISYGSKLLKHL